MNIKKLNEELDKVLNETIIEGNDELQEVLDGTWTGASGHTLADIILPRIDELSVSQLVSILNNTKMRGNDNSLFPSNWYYKKIGNSLGTYPAILAKAISMSTWAENIFDLYNIFYRENGDLDTWGGAAETWKRACLDNPSDVSHDLEMAFESASDLDIMDPNNEYTNELFTTIGKVFPVFIEKLKEEL
jgi:hypothetical protein